MTKRNIFKRAASLLLALIIVFSAGVSLAFADAKADSYKYPCIFVHGILGYGDNDKLNSVTPYWGMQYKEDLMKSLNARGYDCHAASVGPLSSAWDRACELYAQLAGTVVDYGAAHSAEHHHERYGRSFVGKALIDTFGKTDKNGNIIKINLFGHSFGGATVRTLTALLAYGSEEEQAATSPDDISPLFTGGKAGWVHALVAIAAPHDGSMFPDVQPDAANALSTLFLGAARALGISAFKGVYDFRLDQFGIRRDPGEPLTTAALRMLAQNPLPVGDNAFDDLRPAGARALNARIRTLPDAWYFSIPCCRTLPRLLTHDQKPDTAMTPLLWPFSTAMGRDGAGMPRGWLPNSARHHGGAPHADFVPGQTPARGVWQVLPVENLDHLAAIGGVMNTGVVRTRLFYRRVMALLDAAAAADADS